jgi:hypothetical protein
VIVPSAQQMAKLNIGVEFFRFGAKRPEKCCFGLFEQAEFSLHRSEMH